MEELFNSVELSFETQNTKTIIHGVVKYTRNQVIPLEVIQKEVMMGSTKETVRVYLI